MAKKYKSLWDKFWKDKNGKVVIWQTPNLPLILWFIFRVIGIFLSQRTLKNGSQFLATAFILIWAYLEIAKGESYFRRLLGLIIFLMVSASHF